MLLLLVAPTLAGEDACFSCCRAGGLATCDAQLVAYGEGSRMVRESYGWRINGTWTVACDGRGTFDPGDSRLVDHPPLGGELIQRPITPLQVRCFQEACSLPPGVEVSKPDEDGNYFLMDTESGLAADAEALKRVPKTAAAASGTVIMVDGRPLVVEPVAPGATSAPAASPTPWSPPDSGTPASTSPTSSSGTTPWSAPSAPAAASTPAYSPPPSSASTYSAPASAPATTSTASAGPVTRWSRPADPEPGPSVVTTTSPSTSASSPASPSPYLDPSSYPSWSPTPAPTQGSTPASSPAPTTSWSSPAPAPVATPTYEPPAPTYEPPPTPAPTPAPAAPADLFTTLSASIPADPPAACKAPIEVVRAEARKRVDLGDEKRIQQDAAGAVQQYRAALSMDACNAYAWLGIGEIAAQSGRPDLAIRTLGNATRLLPGHYGAWTALGQQYETLHQDTMAAEAYSKALALRPGLQEALDGWRRTASPTP